MMEVLAFSAVALIGLASATIGVYRIFYATEISLWLDVCAVFMGGVMFLGGIASVIGYVAVYGVSQ